MVKSEKDLVMRSVIFASIVLASGIASFGASACDPQREYNQKISVLFAKYQNEIVQANDAFARESLPLVTVVHTHGRHFAREYVVSYPYSYGYNTVVDHWNKTVNTAVTNYSNEAKIAYDNACLWW
jgi:hypothetical protein